MFFIYNVIGIIFINRIINYKYLIKMEKEMNIKIIDLSPQSLPKYKDEYINECVKQLMTLNPQSSEEYCKDLAERIWKLKEDWGKTH